jgi:hypothetical protein
MKMEDDFRDLAPLRPRLDAARWERMVSAVEMAAVPELARRSALGVPGLLGLLSEWTRSAGAAALVVAAAAIAMLLMGPMSGEMDVPGVSDALGYPDAVADWVEVGRTPSVEELVLSLEGDGR